MKPMIYFSEGWRTNLSPIEMEELKMAYTSGLLDDIRRVLT